MFLRAQPLWTNNNAGGILWCPQKVLKERCKNNKLIINWETFGDKYWIKVFFF
jgi:hypothetical protein